MRTFVLIALTAFSFAAMTPLSNVYAADCVNASDQATLNECAAKDYKKSANSTC